MDNGRRQQNHSSWFFLHSCDKDIEKRKKTMMCVGGLNRWKGKWKREEETEIEAK